MRATGSDVGLACMRAAAVCTQAVLDCDVERKQLMAEEKRLMAEASASGRNGAAAGADAASARLKEVYDRLLEIDADGAPARAASILAGLSFDEAMQKRATKTFSGGSYLPHNVMNPNVMPILQGGRNVKGSEAGCQFDFIPSARDVIQA